MRNLLLATVAGAALFSGAALAADLPSRAVAPAFAAPAPLAYSWSGFYVGAHVGGAWTTAAPTSYAAINFAGAATTPASVNPSGFLGGVHAGFNWQMSQVVLGLEADLDLSGVTGTTAYVGGSTRVRDTLRGSLRARVGFAADRALIYATGGLAFASMNMRNFNAVTSASYSSDRTGWTLGGGIEFAVNNQWSVNAEYRYTDLGRWGIAAFAAADPFAGSERSRITDSSVRVGVSYHFGAPAGGAVVAKY